MKDLFVPYELAVKLKEKGFNDPCLGRISIADNMLRDNKVDVFSEAKNYNQYDYCISAPLWQQVVDWLREEKKTIVKIDQTVGNDFLYVVHSAVNTEDFIRSAKRQEYYSAFQSGIEKALELI